MVYPVGSQQQIPAANTFQPGGTEATKRPEENKTPDSTRPSGSDTARSEASSARSNARVEDAKRDEQKQAANDTYQDNGSVSASSSRGTSVDISA